MKKLIYFFFIFLICSIGHSQETISSFDEKNISVLNEELRTARQSIKALNASLTTVIPSGLIAIWSGTIATIPTGWYLCDGTNGTPDLTDKFIVGASTDNSGVAKTSLMGIGTLTQSGGSLLITEANLPAHTHSEPEHTHSMIFDGTGGGSATYPTIAGGGNAQTYTFNTGVSSDTTGSTGSGTKYAQPYYALAYIMKG